MKSAGKARNNGLYRHIRTSKEIIRNLLNDFMKNNGFPCNYNTARDRLEGGEPRKPQLRIKNDEDYMKQIGFISPKRFSLISNAYTYTHHEVITINADEILPGLKCVSMR